MLVECERSGWQIVPVAEIGKSLSVSFNAPVEYPKAACIIDNAQQCGPRIRLQKTERGWEGGREMY